MFWWFVQFQLRLAHPHQSQLPEATNMNSLARGFKDLETYKLEWYITWIMSPREVRRTNVWKLNNNNFGSFIISKVIAHLLHSPPGTPPFWIDWLLSEWSPNLSMVPLRPEDLANGTAQEPESNRNMSVAWWCIRNSKSHMLIQSYTIYDHKANIHVSVILNSPSQSQQLTRAIFLKCLSSFKSVPPTNSYSGM